MLDILMPGIGCGFFAVALAYVYFCEKCEAAMLVDYVVAGGVTQIILAYLVYALLRPERF